MNQHPIAGPNGIDLVEQHMCRQAAQHRASCHTLGDRLRQLDQSGFGQDADFSIGTHRHTRIRDTVSRVQARHAVSNGINRSGALKTEHGRQGSDRVKPTTVVDIDEINPNRRLANADFAWPWIRHGNVDRLQHFRATRPDHRHSYWHEILPFVVTLNLHRELNFREAYSARSQLNHDLAKVAA
jgi:hypothetical protein